MSPIPANLKDLSEARIQRYAAGFTGLSSEEISSFWSQDLVFTDITLNKYEMTYSQVKSFQTTSFGGMKSMQILESHVSGSLESSAWEMLIEMEFKSGQKEFVRGTSLITWRWEGEGTESSDLESIEGWKIVRQHDYFIGLKPENKGIGLKLFD